MWSSSSFDRADSKRFLVGSWASTMHASFVFWILLDSSFALAVFRSLLNLCGVNTSFASSLRAWISDAINRYCLPLACLMVETRPTLLQEHRCALRLVQVSPELMWIFGKTDLFQTTWLFHLPPGIWNLHHFRHENLLRIEPSSMDFWRVHIFQTSPVINTYPRSIPGKTFLPNWWIRDWSLAEIGWYSIIDPTDAPKGIIGPPNGSPNRLSWDVFSSDRRSWTFRRWH